MSTNEVLFRYLLRLADNNFILGHRLTQWCGHGPILEEDIALANIALDKLGTARALYDYAAKIEGKNRTEDDLAFLRSEREFMNSLLAEQPNGDYAQTMVREWFNDVFDLMLYEKLQTSSDTTLAGIAAKAVKELKYHLRHSQQWIIRFLEGTDESRARVETALRELWPFTGERFVADETDKAVVANKIGPDIQAFEAAWKTHISAVLKESGLELPADAYMQSGSKKGVHTEHLGFILAECQYLPRTMPHAKW
ncbi:MAG: 1,2-phenylacetyl-CoA epoxidase subunit PaaC [Flavobacteriales bacterium]